SVSHLSVHHLSVSLSLSLTCLSLTCLSITCYYTTIIFSVLVFPSSFFLLSLIVALVARVTVEQDRADVAKARQREEEFIQILEVMNRRKEEEEEEVGTNEIVSLTSSGLCREQTGSRWCQQAAVCVSEVQEDQSSCPPCCLAFLKWNCCGCWRWLKQRLHTFVTNPFFDFGIVICLILNNVFMAMEHYPMTMEFENLLSITNLVKMCVMVLLPWLQVGWHILDFIIVIVRLLDMIMADIEGLTVLHCFHVMLVLRLARWWPTFHTLIKIMWTAVWALRNLTLILLIMVFVFSVVGWQLFQKDYECSACRIDSDCELPRWHMNGLFQTFLLIFRILCGEWIETMWDCMMVSDQSVCLIFFMTVVVIGHLLVSLFLYLTRPWFTPSDYINKQIYRLFMNYFVQQNEDNKNHRENTPEDCCCHSCYRCCPFLNVDMSRGTWRVWSNFRRACFSIVQHKYFETFIISIILLSSAALVFEDVHLQERTVLQMILDRADQVFTYVFLLEMLLKWLAYGFRKYFTSVWCWIDFLILAVSLMSLTVDMLGYSELEVGLILRTLRALRPLRALSRFQGLRLWSLTVWPDSMLEVRSGATVVHYISNNTQDGFHRDSFCCEQAFQPVSLSVPVSPSPPICLQVVLQAPVMYLYLFHSLYLSAGVSGFVLSLSPSVNCGLSSHLYFGGKHLFMTEEQQKLSRGMKRRLSRTTRKPVPRPQNKCQALLFDLVTKPAFEVFIVVVICLKMLTLMVETDEQSDEKDLILHYINFVFIIIFLVEFLLKIIALGRHYFSDYLNILDFVVIIVSIVGMFIYDFLQKYLISPSFFPVLRLARISRIIPVIPWLVAFVLSLPALFNICLLLFLLLFTYSIFGMFTFAYMSNEYKLYFFESFGSSMMCLFTMTIATGWDSVLRPILNTPPDCDPYMQNPGSTVIGNCGSPTLGIIFFSSYIMLSALLVVHMYIAVVLETFNMDDTENLSDNELQMFYKTWRMFDTDGSQVIQYSQLSDFCDTLQGPLRIPKPNTIKLIHMDLPLLPGDKIHCTDILLAFTAEVFGDSGPRDALKARIEEKFMTNKLPKLSYEPIGSTLQRKQEEVAAMVIQRAYRKHVLQDRAVEATAAEPAGGVSEKKVQNEVKTVSVTQLKDSV
uniref:EF-hand domain-containing protein n=1 Tax=Seriola lalandi dorsalis TaxID=1841481 RepID=A0A3B4YL65_SERLL